MSRHRPGPRFAALILLASLGIGRAANAQVIDQYDYEPDRIYQVRTGLGITTQITLAADDEILDYSTGFSSGWDLDRRGNVFYLKPRNVDADTNMMVRSAERSYIFELKVVATDWTGLEQAKRSGVQYRIAFRYPPDVAPQLYRRYSTGSVTASMAARLAVSVCCAPLPVSL